jgi:hypothetical protein
MADRDELPPALRAALAELAAEGIDELIATARAEARATVAARLRAELERELIAQAATALAPRREPEPQPDAGDGLWLYCVVGADHPGVPEGLPGVSEGRRPRAVRARGVTALVSDVPLAEFGEDALKRNLNDLAWLESTARAHEAVLDAALSRGAVVPMRVCTIYRGEDQLAAMLAERRPELARALESLAGRAEWGVKVIAAPDRLEQLARSRDSAAPSASGGEGGGAYLARKQADRRIREQVDSILDDAVRECHVRLEEWAAGSELLPPQRRELAGYEGEMVLNGVYLVDDERADTFASVVGELREQYADMRMSFDLTGPWPAYHFVGEPAA